MVQLDFRGSQPIYEQIVTQYKYRMLQGYLKKGDAVPSVRRLALELNITPGTVAKAYRELEQQGLIETVRGKGTFAVGVAENIRNEGVIQRVREELKERCIELVCQGLDRAEIIGLVEEIMEELRGGAGDDPGEKPV